MKIRRRRKRSAIMPPVASMGDIAFLLIIFFMLCSSFARDTPVEWTPPSAIEVQDIEETIRHSVAIDADGRVYFNGKETMASSLAGELEAELGGLEKADRLVRFKCDREITRRVYEPVLEAMAEAGAVVVAIGEEPPKVGGQ